MKAKNLAGRDADHTSEISEEDGVNGDRNDLTDKLVSHTSSNHGQTSSLMLYERRG